MAGTPQRVAVPAGHCLPVPDGVTWSTRPALPEVGLHGLVQRLRPGPAAAGETLLIHGGGSGIGTFAIQLADAHGARVVTTARPAKHEALRGLGADVTIDYTTEDFVGRGRTRPAATAPT